MTEEVKALNERWERIQVSNVYDALEKLGYPYQCLSLQIKPLIKGKTLAGPAVTLRGRRAHKTEEEAARLNDPNHTMVNCAVYPGCVLVIDHGGDGTSAKMGEFFAWGLKNFGVKGVVLDGAIRDADALSKMEDFLVFHSCISPYPAGKRWHYDECNMPIEVNGALTQNVTVHPGDWIIGGTDGVLVVPREILMEVLEEAEKIEDYEIGLRKELEAGTDFEEARTKWQRK